MFRLTITLLSVVIFGCYAPAVDKRSPLLILDNNGGFSHGGQRIELYKGGLASVATYTDVINDRSISHGSYELQDDHLLLRYGDKAARSLYRVRHRGKIYWLYPEQLEKMKSIDGDFSWHYALEQKMENKLEMATPMEPSN